MSTNKFEHWRENLHRTHMLFHDQIVSLANIRLMIKLNFIIFLN
jgi:hypothetical protein